ncbi:hypothetical protein SALBM311S_10654 [Streptomyces alboniger]
MNRLLLAAYPEPYRSRQGEEVLACLSEAYPGRSWPPPREVAALVRAGVQARARAVVDDTARPWWLDGIHLAALALAALALAPYLQDLALGTAHRPRTARHRLPLLRLVPVGRRSHADTAAALRAAPAGLPDRPAARQTVDRAAGRGSHDLRAGATSHGRTLFGDEGKAGLSYYGLGAPIIGPMPTWCCRGHCAPRAPCWRSAAQPSATPLVPLAGPRRARHVRGRGPAHHLRQSGFPARSVRPRSRRADRRVGVATAATGDHRWLIPVAAVAIVRTQAIVVRPRHVHAVLSGPGRPHPADRTPSRPGDRRPARAGQALADETDPVGRPARRPTSCRKACVTELPPNGRNRAITTRFSDPARAPSGGLKAGPRGPDDPTRRVRHGRECPDYAVHPGVPDGLPARHLHPVGATS